MLVYCKLLWILAEKVTFWEEFPLSSMNNSETSSVYVFSFLDMLQKSVFVMEFLKLFYINFETFSRIFHINQ